MTAHDIRGRPLSPPTVRPESERIKVTSSTYAPPHAAPPAAYERPLTDEGCYGTEAAFRKMCCYVSHLLLSCWSRVAQLRVNNCTGKRI